MHRNRIVLATIAATLLLPAAVSAATSRTHVSNGGSDANTAFSCDYAHPCRTFAAALGQTTAGGEILAIDGSGYGKVVIDRSVSIIAAPGVFAGIGVGAGGNATGVHIATAGVNVVLRGLTITGQGGTYGINMTSGASLSIEDCAISNFYGLNQSGLRVSAPAQVRVSDTLFYRNGVNGLGVHIRGGAVASMAGVRFIDSSATVYSDAGVTRLGLSDALGVGASFYSNGGATGADESTLDITDSEMGLSGTVAYTWATHGTAAASVGNTLVAENQVPLRARTGKVVLRGNTIVQNNNGFYADTTGVTETDQTNVVRDNVTNTWGTITNFSPM